ncbi:MAG: response regulator [Bacillota bacterium]
MPPTTHPILLVEDDLSLRGSLCQFLGEHGYETITAGTARQGWDLVQAQQPRLCVLDLNLPDGSGLDLLRKIVHHRISSRVVVMTAFHLERMRPVDVSNVLVGWMIKPVNPTDLLTIVQKVMGEGSAAGCHNSPVRGDGNGCRA